VNCGTFRGRARRLIRHRGPGERGLVRRSAPREGGPFVTLAWLRSWALEFPLGLSRRREGELWNFPFLTPTQRIVRHLHRGRSDVDRIELIRQRFDDDPHVVVIRGHQPLAE
jgi:hypothetical protein